MSGFSVGSTLAGCRLEAVAGRGGMGVVYRATQLALNRRVAIKAIVPALASDPAFRERFQRESELAASIDHPNVIPVYEAGEAQGTLYLIMRWVQGTDLRRILDDGGRLEAVRAVRLLRPVAAALGAAHRAGLVHRDVKPANVLIAEGDGEHVYLTDFGIAQRTGAASGLTATGVVVVTPDYTAPERLSGGRATPASDIYSFGCMLYEAVTGEVPYAGRAGFDRVNAHLNDPPPSARALEPDLPDALDAVIARAMAKDPPARFGTADELAAALDAAVAQPSAPAGRRPTAGRNRRTIALALVLGALVPGVVVAAVIVSNGGGHRARSPAGASTPIRPAASAALRAHTPVALGGAAGGMSSDNAGTIWVSVPSRSRLVRITASGPHPITIAGHPTALAALPEGVEAVVDGRLRRFDREGRPAPSAGSAPAGTLITADRSDGLIFTGAADGTVTRADTGATASITPAPNAIAYGEGWLWLALPDGTLERRHRDLSPGKTFSDGPDPTSIAFNAGVWTSQSDGEVTRFDPRKQTIGVNADIHVPGHPRLTEIAAIDDGASTPFVWTISPQRRTLYEISYAGLKVVGSLRLPSAPVALAAASPTTVWVATADNQLVEVTAKRP